MSSCSASTSIASFAAALTAGPAAVAASGAAPSPSAAGAMKSSRHAVLSSRRAGTCAADSCRTCVVVTPPPRRPPRPALALALALPLAVARLAPLRCEGGEAVVEVAPPPRQVVLEERLLARGLELGEEERGGAEDVGGEVGLGEARVEAVAQPPHDQRRLLADAVEGGDAADGGEHPLRLVVELHRELVLLGGDARLQPRRKVHQELQLRQVLLDAVELLELGAAPRRQLTASLAVEIVPMFVSSRSICDSIDSTRFFIWRIVSVAEMNLL